MSVALRVAKVLPLVATVSARLVVLSATAVGATASMVMAKPEDALLTLPAASVTLAVMVWLPLLKVDDVMLQLPPVAVVVPSTVVPSVSYKVTVLPASAVPVRVGVVSLVMLSVLDVPESDAKSKSGVDGTDGVAASTNTELVLPTLLSVSTALLPVASARVPPLSARVPTTIPLVSRSLACTV